MNIYYLNDYISIPSELKKVVKMGLMRINTNFSWTNIYSI